MISFLLCLAWRKPVDDVIGPDYLARLSSKARITDGEAVLLVAKSIVLTESIVGIPDNRAEFSDDTRQKIAAIVKRIRWNDKAGIEGFGQELNVLDRRIDFRQFDQTHYLMAVGLVCAAWDWHVNRPQYAFWQTMLACSDKDVHLIEGTLGDASGGELSRDWPWRSVNGQPFLGKARTDFPAGIYLDKVFGGSEYCFVWSRGKRGK